MNITENDISQLIERIESLNFEEIGARRIRPFDLNIHEIFLQKNDSSYPSYQKWEFLMRFLKEKFKLEDQEITELKNYTKILDERLEQVFSYAIEKECSIMIDAEQSYLQHHFDYFAAYVFKIYNKKKSILSTTLQCYLNTQMQRLEKLQNFCRDYNLKFGLKLVRGAYMIEENNLASELGYPTPICANFEETNDNYNNSLARIFNFLEEEEKVCDFLNFFIF